MFSGIIPPLITPLREDGNVCEESVKNLIMYVRPHVQAIMPALSSGEGWKLSEQQWLDMVLFSKHYASNLSVLAGVLTKTTSEVIARAKLIENHGIDAIVVSTPFQADITQSDIFQHYKTIREAINIPIFIYNEEAISGNKIELDTLFKVFNLDRVVGIKESSGSAEIAHRLIAANHSVFQGWENLCYESRKTQGYILPLANIEPQVCSEMFQNPTMDKQAQINNLCDEYDLFSKTWFASLKKELYRRGIIDTDYIVHEH